jgi:putative ABC transport system permease protein
MNLKIVLRSFLKEKSKFLLIISCLAVGFMGFLILQLYIGLQLSYDTFHRDYENIYRVVASTVTTDGENRIALSDGGLKDYLTETFPSIKSATHFIPIYYGIKVTSGQKSFVEEKGLYVDEDFNHVFDFSIISGDPKSMFNDVNSIALTKSLAIKYFGSVDVLGKELSIDDGFGLKQLVISGIYDEVPMNSSIRFDFLISNKTYPFWDRLRERANKNYFFTYLRFEDKIEKGDKSFIESDINTRNSTFNLQHTADSRTYSIQPMQKTHLDALVEYDLSDKVEPKQIYILLFISLSIVIIATINFINTNTIQSASKIKLLGMVKIFGHRNPFTEILVLDSVLKTLLALCVAIFFVVYLNGSILKQFLGFELSFPSIGLMSGLMFICVLIGVAGGVIPANYLKKKKISELVKGKNVLNRGKHSKLKLTSLTVQLTIVVVLLITTSVVMKQLDYFHDKDVGYNRTDKILIPAPQGADNGMYLNFINGVRSLHYVKNVGVSLTSFYSKYRPLIFKIDENSEEEHKGLYNMINMDYLPAMGIEMKEGKNFSGIYSTDTLGVIVNEAAAKLFGQEEILNSVITANVLLYGNREFRVVGVMKDFHFEPFSKSIEPLFYFCLPFDDFAGDITISHLGSSENDLRCDLHTQWKKSGIEIPLEYESLDFAYSQTYKAQSRLESIADSFTILILFLAVFGLFGYLKHNIDFKTKESAIRRVLGASIKDIYFNLNKEILLLFFVSIIIACPIGYFISMKWLAQFVYRSEIGLGNFLIPIASTLLLISLVGLYELFAIISQKTTDVLKSE